MTVDRVHSYTGWCLIRTIPTGTKSALTDQGGLSEVPNPQALAGLQTLGQREGTERDPQFSHITPLTLLLPDNPQSKKAVAVVPISPPIPTKIAEKINMTWRLY